MRRFFAAVLAAAMLLSFEGCAVKDTQSDSTAPAEEQTTEEKSTEPLTNEDGSLVKPKNAVSVSDDVKIKTYSGSSSSSTRGRFTSARAMATRCC